MLRLPPCKHCLSPSSSEAVLLCVVAFTVTRTRRGHDWRVVLTLALAYSPPVSFDRGLLLPLVSLGTLLSLLGASMVTRKENEAPPTVKSGWVSTDGESVQLDTPAWVAWLHAHTTFSLEADEGTFTARREKRWDGFFWYAYRRHQGTLHKAYLGKAEDLTRERLLTIASKLRDKAGA